MSGAPPPPTARPLGQAAGLPRPACSGCGRCGRGDPALVPQRAPLRAGIASFWGGGRAFPGGGAFHRCEGRLRSGAPPPPTARPQRGLLGSATHVLRARACGCGGPSRSPWPACPVGAACRGGGGGPSPGGMACHRCEGCLVSGAVPPPAVCPLGRVAGVPRPVCPRCGWCGRGDPAPALFIFLCSGLLCTCFVAAECAPVCVRPSYHILLRGFGGLLATWHPWVRRCCSFAIPCVACASARVGLPLALFVLSGLFCACCVALVLSPVVCGSLHSLAHVPHVIPYFLPRR